MATDQRKSFPVSTHSHTHTFGKLARTYHVHVHMGHINSHLTGGGEKNGTRIGPAICFYCIPKSVDSVAVLPSLHQSQRTLEMEGNGAIHFANGSEQRTRLSV